jgi:hypothetical protein
MADYLRFTDKLYLAGEAGNWELARWYAWKLTKASFPVKASKVVEYRSVEEYDLAALTREMLDPAIAALNDAIAAENGTMFRKRHAALRDACNACHHATRHGQVHVIVPGRSAYPGQQFRPTADADGRGHDPIPAEPAKRTPDGVRR